MAVRKIKKSYISCVGYFKSYKNNKQLAFESILERDFFMLLEFDKDVVSFEEQPFQIRYNLKDSANRYTPDLLATYKDGSQKVFEVKYKNEIDSDEELKHKLSVLTQEIEQQKSLHFEVFTDAQIDSVYLKNCNFLYKYAFLTYNVELKTKITQAMTNQASAISVKEFLTRLSTDATEQLKFLPYLWHEVFNNRSLVDMNQPITMSSLLHTRSSYE